MTMAKSNSEKYQNHNHDHDLNHIEYNLSTVQGKLVIRMGEPGPEEQHHQLALLG